MKQSLNYSSFGTSKTPPVGTSTEFGSGPWGILSGSYADPDATLFSSSLPVLPHEKLNTKATEHGFESVDDVLPRDEEGNNLLEDVETHAIGGLLPNDVDDLLSGILDDFDLSRLPGSLEDLEEYDLFGSGGGMELETESMECLSIGTSKLSLSDGFVGNGMPQYGLSNGVGTVAGEHPYGEHPSRTLFVRNINSSVEDSELIALFEQYGDIRTLYTQCKNRGFVMISYYDIRAARTAMRALQNKPLRRRKLDIHFSIPKDNPSDKDMNQGTLVAFNLDPSVSNEDLRQIFGLYGEVKEIRETPHKKHHKFIEFYDVRAAEAALKALNRSDIAGKRIKLEPSRPGGARRNLMLQLNQELEQDEFRQQVGSPISISPPGNWGQFNSPIEHSPLQSISKSPVFGTISPSPNNHLPGLASILHPQSLTSGKIAPIGKDQIRGNHNTNTAQGAVFQQSRSFTESKFGQYHGSLPSFGPSTPNGSGMDSLSGPQFLWGSSNPYSENTSSSAWGMPSVRHSFASNGNDHVFPYSARPGPFVGSSHHYVGSAPSGIPLERHSAFLSESPETSFMNSVSFGGSMGLGRNDGNYMLNMGALHGSIGISGNMTENGSSSFRMTSSPRQNPMFLGNGSYPGLLPNIGGFTDHGRSRRTENNGNQLDSKKQFQLDLDKIVSGEDTRTTLMLRNIPNKYTSKMLLSAIDENHRGAYDFFYLPIDFKNKCNVGYAFINMLSPKHIIPFYEAFNGKKWEKFNSEKVASLAYARIQGKAALVTHFQNSSLMNEDKRCRPILFHSEGPEAGDQIIQEHLPSPSLNFHIQQQNGSLSGNVSGSPTEDDSDKMPQQS